jgi:predicted CopG family antitoxin
MAQLNRKTIVIHNDLYEELKRLGTVTESFNDVIWKLIQKAASGRRVPEKNSSQTAAALMRSEGRTIK